MATIEKPRSALADSGASCHFAPVEAAGNPSDWKACGGEALAANGQSMPILGKCEMHWPGIPPQDHKVLAGVGDTILSISQLADLGWISVFLRDRWLLIEESSYRINPEAHIVSQGYRENQPGGLYRMDEQPVRIYDVQRVNSLAHEILSEEYEYDDFRDVAERCMTIATVNTYYQQIKLRNVAERAAFYHAVFGFPSVSTMYRALARHLTLPGLTHHEFADNAPKSVHTVRGHLHELPQGQGSTKPVNEPLVSEKIVADPAELEKLSAERQLPRNLTPGYLMDLPDNAPVKQGEWFMHKSGSLAADATGKMTVPSYLGHTAIWIAHHPASGYVRAMPFRSKSEISRMLEYLHTEQIRLGNAITTINIDNEIDNDARAYFASHGIKINNVAPYNHRANPAERAIGTFKDHFIAILSGRDPTCPLNYWNEAIFHAEVTLNLMRPGPNGKSAYEAYWGKPYDLDAYPMVPWGTRCESYIPKSLRTTFGQRSQPAFYVGVAYNNYRSHRLISVDQNKKTTVYVRQQVVFHPWEVSFLKWSELDDLKERVSDLAKTMLKVHGKTNAKASNAAESLRAYCDAMILDDENEKGDFRERFVSGSGPIHWLGPQKIDATTGAVIEEFEKPADFNPPPAIVPQPPIATTPPPIEVVVPTEKTPAELLGLEPERAEPEQIPAQVQPRVSEGVQANTQEMHLLEGDLAPPLNIPTGVHNTRAAAAENARQAKVKQLEDARQERLNELALQEIDSKRLPVIVDSNRVNFVDKDWIMVASKKERRLNVLKEQDHKTLTIRQAMKLEPELADLWRKAMAEELERFLEMPGLRMLKPGERPYGNRARKIILVLEHKSGKDRRVRGAFDGSPKDNREEQYTQYNSDIDTKKIFWSALATKGVEGYRHCTMDIAAFFLHNRNLLSRVEHMLFPAEFLPNAYKERFASFIGEDGMAMFECGQAVYGMYDAGTIAGRVLAETLTAADYYEVGLQSSMWRSKYPGEEHVLFNVHTDDMDFMGHPDLGHKERFLKVLSDAGYVLTNTSFADDVQHFCGYQIVHDSKANTVMVSMPGYVDEMLVQFGMETVKIQDHPYRYTQPAFSAKQSPAKEDESKLLSPAEIKELQQKLGKLQWYCGLCYEIVTKVGKIASEQSKPTAKQLKDINHVIAYLAGHKNTALFFNPSDMQLSTESDASFASESKSKSRIGGVFLIGGYGPDDMPLNSPIAVFSKIADCHPDSAAEAEYVACHDVVKRGVSLRTMLAEFGFPQVKASENRSDNECAVKMTNGLVMDRKTKHIDRRYHWVRHELKKGTFTVKWYKGSSNLADFFTKLLSKEQHDRFTKIFTKQYIAEGVSDGRPLGPTNSADQSD